MVTVRCYAVPLPDGYALCVPPDTAGRLLALGFVAARQQTSLAIEVFAPQGFSLEEDGRAAAVAAARTAALIALSPHEDDPPAGPGTVPGPGPRWTRALLFWGLLLAAFSGGNSLVVLAGLWLLVGLPWFRAAYHRRLTAAGVDARRCLSTLGVDEPSVSRVSHDGLSALEELVRGAADPESGRRAAALACNEWGLADLQPWYTAAASGARLGFDGAPYVLLPRRQQEASGERPQSAEAGTTRPPGQPSEVNSQQSSRAVEQ